jgi:hypothetical protein
MSVAMHGEQAHRRSDRLSVVRLTGLFVIVSAVLVVTWISGGSTGILCLAPALAIVTVLLTRRYPGEQLLLRGVAPLSKRWPRIHPGVAASRRAVVFVARGGALIARALAVRPPPRISSAAS